VATETNAKATLPQRATHELKEFAILAVYLYITIGAVIMMKTAVLHTEGVDFAPWGIAIVKAMLLAKFMLVGRAMKIGERDTTSPLIWPTLHRAFAFLVLLIILTIIEEAVVGLFHHRSIAASLGELVGVRLEETLAGYLIMLLVLIPYFAQRDARRRQAGEDVFCRAEANGTEVREAAAEKDWGRRDPYCRAIAMRMASSGETR
jgi:hypothetical protein